MIARIQQLPRGQRVVIFILLAAGVILSLVAVTVLLAVLSINSGGRSQSVALLDGVTVREFGVLPDDDSYPAAVAAASDGSVVYTGSYVSGTIWGISPEGMVTQIDGTRRAIGVLAGLTIAPDNTLYMVDQQGSDEDEPGGYIWQLAPAGELTEFAYIPDERGFTEANDIALDAAGNVYISQPSLGEIWRYTAGDKAQSVWWTPPTPETGAGYAPTGLAYDAVNNALIVTDSSRDSIFSVSIDDQTTATLYEHGTRDFPPGLDGVTLAPDGTIYVAAQGQNGIAALVDGELEYIAGSFRGSSDVDYAAGKLYVANFDASSLVRPGVWAGLPFAIDVIELPTP